MRPRRTTLTLVGIALLAGMSSACLDFPRNGQVLDAKTSEVSFEGFYLASGMQVKLYIKNNNTQAWEHLPHPTILTGGNGITDNAGDTWYYFSQKVVLPQGAQYWGAGPNGKRTVVAKVKSTVVGSDGNEQTLTTFDVDADGCIQQYESQGGWAIRQHCASAESPVATLNVSCGASGQICCLASPACDYGKNCSSGTCSASCGGLNQTCCNASPGCGANTICEGNVCVACGATGETCCAGGACSAGNVCQNGSCATCGGLNQPCCGGGGCSSGLACSAGICTVPPCGGYLQPCCGGGTCPGSTDAQPLLCDPTANKCDRCGNHGQRCCSGASVCQGNLACTSTSSSTYKCESCDAYGNCS